MKKKPGVFRPRPAWALAVLLAGTLCSFFPSGAAAQREPAAIQIQRVALLPFFRGVAPFNEQESLSCPVCNLSVDREEPAPDADRILTDLVQSALERRYGQAVVPLSTVRGVFGAMPRDEARDTPLSLALKTGRALEANQLMVGFLWKFRERVGGSMGVETPASVAFILHLVEVSSGDVLWKGSFQETQRSLSENILEAPAFFKRGAKWLTAEELARHGVNEVLRKMGL